MRIPRPRLTSPAGSYAPGRLGWGPVARPARRLPMGLYTRPVTSIPLTGGQAQGKISAAGAATLSVGPSGSGNVWYPASLTASTTSGLTGSDPSICNVYLGPAGVGVTLLGTLNPGSGVASFALPAMSPGQYLIAVWAGGNPGDVATVNITGTMDSVMPA